MVSVTACGEAPTKNTVDVVVDEFLLKYAELTGKTPGTEVKDTLIGPSREVLVAYTTRGMAIVRPETTS
jgi:hypothetical protein